MGDRKCLRDHRQNAGETWGNDRQGDLAVLGVIAGDHAVLEQISQLKKLKNDLFKQSELYKLPFKYYQLKSTKSNLSKAASQITQTTTIGRLDGSRNGRNSYNDRLEFR